jgi:hypothetical protein
LIRQDDGGVDEEEDEDEEEFSGGLSGQVLRAFQDHMITELKLTRGIASELARAVSERGLCGEISTFASLFGLFLFFGLGWGWG